MQNTGNGGHRAQAPTGLSATQVFYAGGEKTSTGMVGVVLDHLGVRVTHFDDAEDCLDSLRTRECHLLVSNAKWPAVEGVALLRAAKRIAPSLPVVVMVDHGDIHAAVRAMQAGAVDCFERPPEREPLATAIASALRESVRNSPVADGLLTRTEEHVLCLVLQGHTTAETAQKLHRSRRTIEVHRSHIMHKLEVSGMVDLVRRCAQMGLLENWP